MSPRQNRRAPPTPRASPAERRPPRRTRRRSRRRPRGHRTRRSPGRPAPASWHVASRRHWRAAAPAIPGRSGLAPARCDRPGRRGSELENHRAALRESASECEEAQHSAGVSCARTISPRLSRPGRRSILLVTGSRQQCVRHAARRARPDSRSPQPADQVPVLLRSAAAPPAIPRRRVPVPVCWRGQRQAHFRSRGFANPPQLFGQPTFRHRRDLHDPIHQRASCFRIGSSATAPTLPTRLPALRPGDNLPARGPCCRTVPFVGLRSSFHAVDRSGMPQARGMGMRVLGLGTEGDSGAAIVEDGRILAAVNEERISRLKLVEGFPRGSIQEVLRRTGTTIADLDAVLVASTHDLFVNELRPFDGWFQHRIDGVGTYLKRATGKFARYRDQLPFLETGYYALLTPSFLYRRWAIRRILRNELGVRCPIRFVDHHLAHIASAYFTSGYDDALVLSVDGGGDGKSALVYAVRHGPFERLHEVSSYNSLGNYYAYVTHLCGFKAMKHEGKITGLAAHGEPRYVDLLREFIDEQDGTFINKGKVAAFEALRELERRLPRGWTREDLAASIQRHTEDVVRRFVRYWASRTGLRNLALAGGVFANVRVNEEVLNLPEVDRVFIHPHMGDGGLPVGAALAACI